MPADHTLEKAVSTVGLIQDMPSPLLLLMNMLRPQQLVGSEAPRYTAVTML